MTGATLEHVNVTVSNPEKTAGLLCELFDWQVRWQGPSAMGGRTVHVGTKDAYVAVYKCDDDLAISSTRAGVTRGGLNHIGVIVRDLDVTERRIQKAGFKTHNHGDYAPGRRFYFNDHDGVEYEIVHYPEIESP